MKQTRIRSQKPARTRTHWAKPDDTPSLMGLESATLRCDDHFLADADQILRSALSSGGAIKRFEGYTLEPGSPVHLRFLRFLTEELDHLPFNNQVGESIPMRHDALSVVRTISNYLNKQGKELEGGRPWDASLTSTIAGIFTNDLELFKNQIYPGMRQRGICYSVDLSAGYDHDNERLSPVGMMLERFYVTAMNKRRFKVMRNGKIYINVNGGTMGVFLDSFELTNPHTR